MNTMLGFYTGLIVLVFLVIIELRKKIPFRKRSWPMIIALGVFLVFNSLVYFYLSTLVMDLDWRYLVMEPKDVPLREFLYPSTVAAAMFGLQELPVIKLKGATNINQLLFKFSHMFMRIRDSEIDETDSQMVKKCREATNLFRQLGRFRESYRERAWNYLDSDWANISVFHGKIVILKEFLDKLKPLKGTSALYKEVNNKLSEIFDELGSSIQQYVKDFLLANRENSNAVRSILDALEIKLGPGERDPAELYGRSTAISIAGGLLLGIVMTIVPASDGSPVVDRNAPAYILLFILALGIFGWSMTLGMSRSKDLSDIAPPLLSGMVGGFLGHSVFFISELIHGAVGIGDWDKLVIGAAFGALTGCLLHLGKHVMGTRPIKWYWKYVIASGGASIGYVLLALLMKEVLESTVIFETAYKFATIGAVVGLVLAKSTGIFERVKPR